MSSIKDILLELEGMAMIGFVFGFACGMSELFLLRALIYGIQSEKIPVWILPAKMAVLAVFFVPCAIFFREQLHVAGIAAAAALIAGAAVLSLLDKRQHERPAHSPLDEVAE